jgi:outer membrane protein
MPTKSSGPAISNSDTSHIYYATSRILSPLIFYNPQGPSMKLLPTLCCIALALTPITAYADFLGLYFGGGTWQAAPDGNIGRSDIDLESTLNLDEENNQFVFAALEHPIPLLPNLRLQHSEMSWSGNALVNAGTDLNGTPFVSSEQVDVSLDLTHTDATLYYELLDTVVNLDLGLTARLFDGEASLIGATQQEFIELDATVPLLYGALKLDIPTTGFSVGLEANWVNVDEFRLVDYSAQLAYDFDLVPELLDAGLVLGYRSMLVELDDLDELQSDATFEGYFLALQFHF